MSQRTRNYRKILRSLGRVQVDGGMNRQGQYRHQRIEFRRETALERIDKLSGISQKCKDRLISLAENKDFSLG